MTTSALRGRERAAALVRRPQRVPCSPQRANAHPLLHAAVGDGTVSFEARQDPAHPLVFHDVQAGGFRRASTVYFDQFRYSALVRFQGADYHVTSRRCAPLTATGDACTLPKSPYAQSDGASAPAAGGSDSWVDSTLTVDGLPGRLKLVVGGNAQPAYCGPTGELGAIALELLPKFVFGTDTSLGGDCPGFRPSVEWSYRPPATFKPSDFARLCLQGPDLCDVPQAQLAQWVTGAIDGGPQPEIADFRLTLYKEREPDHVWSDEEMSALVEAAEHLARRAEARYDYAPLIKTALATGLRLGELLGLQWGDIDLHADELHVRRQWTRLGEYAPPKTRAAVRRVPLSPDMATYLTKHKFASDYSKDDDPVFASKSGRPLGHRNATGRGFEVAAKEAGLEGVSFHSMRHAFASRMIDRGISSTVLAKIMGHESSVITERRYVHVFDKQRTDDAVRQAMAFNACPGGLAMGTSEEHAAHL